MPTLPTTHLVPSRRPSDRLLVVLHGRGDHAGGFRWLPDALGLDDLGYLLVDAPDPWGPGLSWYDLPPHQAPGVLRSRGLLDALFASLVDQGQDPARTALLGFSQGCLMTLEWGARTALPLAAYVGVSGYVLDPEALLAERHAQADRPVWLVTHGLHDEVLPFEVTAAQVARLQQGGLPVRFEAWPKTHTIDPHEELPAIRAFLQERLGLA
ncbi:MAG: serine esterase [Alphaproteobacteria bacterium]|nr:serine esterase [Alphaproteobacteria bacterium]